MSTTTLSIPQPQPLPSAAVPRIAIVGSSAYLSPDHVRAIVSRIPSHAVVILTGYCGVNRQARTVAVSRSLVIEQVRWDCKPRLVLAARPTAILIFYDNASTTSTYLEDLALAARSAHIPVAMFDNHGKSLAFRTELCATDSGTAISTRGPGASMSIVDAPIDTIRDGLTTKVRVTLAIPEQTYLRYEAQARAGKIVTEKCMIDRLRQCVDHTASRSLYFDDAQRSTLERITGGHVIHTPDQALTHIRTTCAVKINDIDITLAPTLLQRATARAKASRIPIEKWLEREIVQGLERSTGLRPW